jgi:hypothetical protein
VDSGQWTVDRDQLACWFTLKRFAYIRVRWSK